MNAEWFQRWSAALARSPAVPAGVAAMAVVLIWSADDGATDPLVWAPGTLFIVAMLAVLAFAAPGTYAGGHAGLVALAAMAAFTAWCYVSIAWADVRADALAGSNKTLAYFAFYALFALRPWPPRAAAVVVGLYSGGVAAIGLWSVISIDRGQAPGLSFIAGRFVEPISYANANCALYACAAFPALYLGSRRETPVVLRGLMLASVVVLAECAMLAESRMSLLATPVVLVLYFAVMPTRLRSLLGLAIVGIAIALSAQSLLDVYSAGLADEGLGPAVDAAQRAITLSGAYVFLAGIAWALVDSRVTLPRRLTNALGVVAAIGAVVVVAAAAGGFVHRYGNPVDRAPSWWEHFKADEYVTSPGTPHLTSGFGGAGRYQIWSVALRIFEDHPVTGIGVDNFGVDWLRERPNTQDNVYPHSVELRLLQQTGVVGTALFLLFLVTALWIALRRAWTQTREERGLVLAALLVVAYWLVHGSVDWLWEIPALAAAAFAMLGLAVGLSPAPDPAPARAPARWPLAVGAAVLAVAAFVATLPVWLSARQVEVALRSARTDAVFAQLDRARSLNPLTAEPDVLGALIAAQRGDKGRQRVLLAQAIERNPYDWFPYVELGLLDAREGKRRSGLAQLAKAQALNPRDETIAFAVERVKAGRPPTAAEMQRRYVESAASCCTPS